MGVIDPNAGIYHGLGAVKEELQKLNAKFDKLVPPQSSLNVKEESKGTFVLKCKENLVWWTKVENAARYFLLIYIDGEKVGTIDFDRETRYYFFEKIPKGICFVINVIAEDRNGKEIVSTSIRL